MDDTPDEECRLLIGPRHTHSHYTPGPALWALDAHVAAEWEKFLPTCHYENEFTLSGPPKDLPSMSLLLTLFIYFMVGHVKCAEYRGLLSLNLSFGL